MDHAVEQALLEFFEVAKNFIGKDLQLSSKQPFYITCDKEDAKYSCWKIQYGFPESGCVCLSARTTEKTNIDLFQVFITAPSANKESLLTLDVTGGINFCIDTEAVECKTMEEIAKNPNAMKMITFATQDLSQAEVLGSKYNKCFRRWNNLFDRKSE